MATYTWIGNKGTSDPNDVGQAANWSPAGGPPGDGDTAIIGTGATLDATSGGSVTGFTIEAAGTDTFNFTDQIFITSSLTLGDQTVLNLTSSGLSTAGFDVNNNGGNNSKIHQSGTGSALTINAAGTIIDDGFTYLDSPGGSLTVNVTQNGTIPGDFYLTGPLFNLGGTLTLNSDNTAATGANSNRVSNAGYVLIASENAAASAKYNARMDGRSGVTELINGGAGAALLEINTSMPGAQIVSFGGGAATVKIDATTVLPAYANIGTITTTVLQNQFERFNLFGPGDTIDLAGISATGLSYSFGKDASFGNNVLTLSNAGGTVARLRFTNSSAYADGTASNFLLASDGAGGTSITVAATPVDVVNAGTTYAVGGAAAAFIGPTVTGTLDWGNAANWAGSALPGAYQTAQITNSVAQLTALTNYVLTVSSAETAGGLALDDHFATLRVNAALTLQAVPGQGSGGGVTETGGRIDIAAGGTITAVNLLQVGSKLIIEAGGKLALSGSVPFSAGIGLRGVEIDEGATLDNGTITSGGAIVIGQNGSGHLDATNGSSVTATYTSVGSNPGNDPTQPNGVSSSNLNISGVATVWRDVGGDASTAFSGALLVGGGGTAVNAFGTVSLVHGGSGAVNIDQGATLIDSGYASLGVRQGSTGIVNVQNGAHWIVNTGSVNLPGSVVVAGNTLFSKTPALLSVGQLGSGQLNIFSGGTVTLGSEPVSASQFNVALGFGGNSSVGVRPTGSLNVDAALLDSSTGVVAIGLRGDGVASVTNGGTLLAGAGGGIPFGVVVGNSSYVLNSTTIASTGTLMVAGNTGTALVKDSADFVAGRDGVGFVMAGQGGSISVAGGLYIGGYGATAGLAIGQGSRFVANGGTASIAGNATLWAGNTLDVEGAGGVEIGGTTSAVAGALVVDSGHTLAGSGRVVVNSAGSSLINSGTVVAFAPLTIDAIAVGGGVYTTAVNGTLTFGRGVANTAQVQFGGGGAATIALGSAISFNATIGAMFGTGYKLDLLNYNPTGATQHWTQIDGNGGTLQIVSTSGTVTLSVAGYHPGGFNLTTDGQATPGIALTAADATACYAEGTRILTSRGEIAVEDLRSGDLLPTLLHGGGLQPITWIGVSTVRLDAHPAPDRAAPIRVRAGALGQGVPHRDLRLSPDHALLIEERLIPAHLLVNGASIVREPARGTVRYFHIELARHDAILAEGAPAETYLDTGNRDLFDNGGTVRVLHPQFDAAARAMAVWADASAAPILLHGADLEAIHARLAARAERLGHARTADPALVLNTAHGMLPLHAVSEDAFQAVIPPGVVAVHLLSRCTVPSAADRRIADHRRLGVALDGVQVDGAGVPASAFGPGFHPVETGGADEWRWTDGAATLRLGASPVPRVLTLRLRRGWMQYWAAA